MIAVGAPLAADPLEESYGRNYERIARVIQYLRAHTAEQPDLAAIARQVHLSEHHFHRLFTRWAGVSPKRFLQCLTVEEAKARLLSSKSVLDAAGAVGLSASSRLHDLFVTVEAVSPGEFRSGGTGIRIGYGIVDSPFGHCLIASTARGICAISFLDAPAERTAVQALEHAWPRARVEPDLKQANELARRVFAPLEGPPAKPLAVLVKGTNFQVQVWRALLHLPVGTLTTYGRIAACIERPAAARAVGTAIGANPIAYLIPCHRVIRESGHLGGYRWGEARKAAILGREAARTGAVAS
jgi:AraC family transcriptional regulator of adaptative response/methylated-DNA-[protein]-cysteine methyltransferase